MQHFITRCSEILLLNAFIVEKQFLRENETIQIFQKRNIAICFAKSLRCLSAGAHKTQFQSTRRMIFSEIVSNRS